MGHRHQHSAMGTDASTGDDALSPPTAHAHRHSSGCTGTLLALTGLDVFTRGRAADGLARARKASNPFDLGIIGNCKDFWTAGRELGVEYERLYDLPGEGFREAKRRKEREEEEDGRGPGRKGKGHFMGFSLSFGRNRAGYEPVSQV